MKRAKSTDWFRVCRSDQSLIGKKNQAVYGMSKGAIAQLGKSTAVQYAADWSVLGFSFFLSPFAFIPFRCFFLSMTVLSVCKSLWLSAFTLLRVLLSSQRITCNVVCPGTIDTPLVDHAVEQLLASNPGSTREEVHCSIH